MSQHDDMSIRARLLFALAALLWSIVVQPPVRGAEQEAATYSNPPARVVWIEGEDCTDHNFVPGEMRHAWWYGYAGVSGSGVLDLASWELPPEGVFSARFGFELPEEGLYRLYFRGRFPGYQASPIEWKIDDGNWGRHPRPGEHQNAHTLGFALNCKMALVDLGEFRETAGRHTLTIRVREFVHDRGESFISQGIDSLLISRIPMVPVPERAVVASAVAGAGTSQEGAGEVLRFETTLDPSKPEYPGLHIRPQVSDWSVYDRLRLRIRVTGNGEHYAGRLRCYHRGSQFRDLIVHVGSGELGQSKEFEFRLAKEFGAVDRSGIHQLWLYSYSRWYTSSAALSIEVESVELNGPNRAAVPDRAVPAQGEPPPGGGVGTDADADAFVWNVPAEAPGSPVDLQGLADSPDTSGYVIEAGALVLELSPIHAGVRRITFGGVPVSQASPSVPVLRVEFMDGGVWNPTAAGVWERRGRSLVYRTADERLDAEVTFTPAPADEEVRVHAMVRNLSDTPIWRLDLGPIRGMRLPGAEADSALLVGSRRFAVPTLGVRQSLVSPRLLTHDWACLHDVGEVVHTRWEDKGLLDTRATFGRAEDGVHIRLSKFPRILPGTSWTTPTLVIGACSRGGWHAAADRFRGWWQGWAKRPHVPDWFRGVGALTVGGAVYDVDAAEAVAGNAARLEQALERFGLGFFHTGSWLPLATEAWYPHGYRLSPEQLRQLRRATDGLRAIGGRLSIYSNPLMFSRVVPEYGAYGADMAVVARDGLIVTTEHSHRHHPMALPYANASWAERFCDAMEPAVVDGCPDALYMDQIGAVPMHLDFACDAHGHEHYGQWQSGQAEFVRRVVERFAPRCPELVTAIEGPNAGAQQYATFALMMGGRHDVFRFAFPWYLNAVGSYGDVDGPTARGQAETALLTGQPLLMLLGSSRDDPDAVARVREIVRLKREVDPLLYGGSYRDTVGLSLCDGLRASVFVEDGGLLLPFVNVLRTEAELLVSPDVLGVDAPATGTLFVTGVPASVSVAVRDVSAGRFGVTLPAARAGLVRLTLP